MATAQTDGSSHGQDTSPEQHDIVLVLQLMTKYRPHPGVWVQDLRLPDRHAWGRSAEIELSKVQARLHIDEDLVGRSFHASGAGYQLAQVNSGNSLPDWLKNQVPSDMRPILACNALHTNFVRGNGFVIIEGRLICKPAGVIPLDGDKHQPLEGAYTALILSSSGARIGKLELRQGSLLEKEGYHLAISGPGIVHQGRNTASENPVRLAAQGQTVGDEVNFSPHERTSRTSFTAFGVNRAGRLLAVSILAGAPRRIAGVRDRIIFQPAAGDGVTLYEMADLMIQLGAEAAILAGGSGDTQHAIQGNAAWCALPRPQASRIQAAGRLRGLGAILAIYDGLT